MPSIRPSPAFKRAYKFYVSKHPESIDQINETLLQLELDPRATSLKTHKLQGELKGYLACSAGYDLRIVFEENKTEDYIVLITIGTHDEVYR